MDDPLRERFLSLRCFLVEPDIGPLTMDDIGAMKAIQDEAFGDEAADKDSRLVYHTRANVAVFRRDILCMKAGGWMKDEIVNMYMALLQVTLPCNAEQLLLQQHSLQTHDATCDIAGIISHLVAQYSLAGHVGDWPHVTCCTHIQFVPEALNLVWLCLAVLP